MHFLRYEDTSLYVFAGSQPIQSPMNLLQYDKLEALMNTLRPMFDYIVLDTPPCAMMADALALAICHGRAATSLLNTERVFDPMKYDTR